MDLLFVLVFEKIMKTGSCVEQRKKKKHHYMWYCKISNGYLNEKKNVKGNQQTDYKKKRKKIANQ